MSRNDLRSQSLDLLRFPLAVVVLIIHTFSVEGFKIHGTEISFENMPVLMEINYFIDGFLRGQSVPIYFFISGYVFFLGVELDKEHYVRKLKNRVKTLLIPYLIWNVLAVLIVFPRFLPCFASLFPNIHKVGIDWSWRAIAGVFWNNQEGIFVRPSMVEEITNHSIYPQDIPLWFVRDLMLVVLCTPLIYWLLKRTRYYLVTVLGGLWFVLAYWDLGHVNQLLTAFFFFSWGAYMSVNQKDMMKEFNRMFTPSVVLYPLLALLYVASAHYFPDYSDTIKRLNVFVGLFFAYNVSSWLLNRHVCKVSPFLASSSFFIYVAHTLICGDLLKCLFMLFHPVSDGGMLAIYVLTVVLTVAFLLLAFYILRRYAPSFLKVIAGRK